MAGWLAARALVPGPRTAWSGCSASCGLLEHGDDLLQGALLGQALLEPHVRAGHLLAGPGAERGLALRDQLAELLQLLLVFGQVAGVGGELVAGQARVAAVAGLAGREHAQPVRQHPVGALAELDQREQVARVEFEVGAVGGDLLVAQELPLVRLPERVGVSHRHLRREVPEVALDHVHGDARVDQARRARVPETVHVGERRPSALAVADVGQLAELLEAAGDASSWGRSGGQGCCG